MQKIGLMMIGLMAMCGTAQPAAAVMPFHKVFLNHYLGGGADPESDLAKLVNDKELKKFRCLVCHQGKKKKHHNPYGQHLRKLLDKKKDKKDVEKIIASLEIVAKLHSDPEDENSPTYGELIAEGKLPGGSLEDLKKEPLKNIEPPKDDEEGDDSEG